MAGVGVPCGEIHPLTPAGVREEAVSQRSGELLEPSRDPNARKPASSEKSEQIIHISRNTIFFIFINCEEMYQNSSEADCFGNRDSMIFHDTDRKLSDPQKHTRCNTDHLSIPDEAADAQRW